MNEGQIPKIWEDEKEANKPFKDLREFYIKYAKIHFQGKKYLNNGIGESILVSRDGIDKLESMINSREQCLAIRLLDIFLTDSVVEGRKPDMKNRWNVDEFVYLAYQCRINDKLYKVRTTIKKTANNPLKFYGYILINLKIEATRR